MKRALITSGIIFFLFHVTPGGASGSLSAEERSSSSFSLQSPSLLSAPSFLTTLDEPEPPAAEPVLKQPISSASNGGGGGEVFIRPSAPQRRLPEPASAPQEASRGSFLLGSEAPPVPPPAAAPSVPKVGPAAAKPDAFAAALSPSYRMSVTGAASAVQPPVRIRKPTAPRSFLLGSSSSAEAEAAPPGLEAETEPLAPPLSQRTKILPPSVSPAAPAATPSNASVAPVVARRGSFLVDGAAKNPAAPSPAVVGLQPANPVPAASPSLVLKVEDATKAPLPPAELIRQAVVKQPKSDPAASSPSGADAAVKSVSLQRSFLLEAPNPGTAVVKAEPAPPAPEPLLTVQPASRPVVVEAKHREVPDAAELPALLPEGTAAPADAAVASGVAEAPATPEPVVAKPAPAAAPVPEPAVASVRTPEPAQVEPPAAVAEVPASLADAVPVPAVAAAPVQSGPRPVPPAESGVPEAIPAEVPVPSSETVSGPLAGAAPESVADAESGMKVDGEPPKPLPASESVALPEELRIGVVQDPPSRVLPLPSQTVVIKDGPLEEEPELEAPAPGPAPSRPGMPPPHDLAPWAIVDSRDGRLPVFDSSMPVIRNEVARLQLEEWSRHVDEAVSRHPSVRAAEYAEQESISSIGEARSQLYPQVSLGLNTDLRRSIREGEPYATVSGLPADDEVRLNPNLSIRQLVFDGGATSARGRAAAARSDAARERRVSTEEGVALRAVATMIDLAKIQEQLEFARENLSEVSRLRDMIRARVDAGRDAPSEMLQMNSRVFEARNQVVLLEGRRTEAGARYEEVFGGTPVVLAFPDVFAPIPMSLSGGMDAALRRNPDLLASKALVQAASSDYKAAWGALYPRLEVEANLTSYDATRNGKDYYDSFVGLKLSHSILDGGLKRSTKARTRSQLERARSEYDNTQRAVELALKRAYANREALIPQYKALQAQLDHKRETQYAYEEQFLAGRRPLNDLVSAQQQVIDTALRTIDYKGELHRQHFVILSLVGELFKGQPK